jgi:hypothetical protein
MSQLVHETHRWQHTVATECDVSKMQTIHSVQQFSSKKWQELQKEEEMS